MINKLVLENIKYRWVRTFLCALVVAVQVMSILTLIGLSRGILQSSAERARGTRADIFLKPDTGGAISLSSGQINEKFVNFVARQPHMTEAVGVLSVPVEPITTINNVPQLRAFIAVITVLAVVVGFLVVFLSMYTAVVERTREIGILKALGAKPATVVDILVREAVLLAIAGCIMGIALSFAAKAIIMGLVPASMQVVNVPEWWPYSAIIAIGGALL